MWKDQELFFFSILFFFVFCLNGASPPIKSLIPPANNDDSFLMCTPRALVITQETNFSRGFSVGLGSRDTIFPFIFFRLLFFAFNVSITQNVANTKGIPRGEAHRNSSSSVGSFGSVASSSSFSSRKGGVHKMIFYSISSTSVGFFFFIRFNDLSFSSEKKKNSPCRKSNWWRDTHEKPEIKNS